MEIRKSIRPFRPKFPRKIFLLCLLNLLFLVQAQQFVRPHFNHFTIDNGLSQNLVYSITQDYTGFMWFGTKDGLNRFDGYDFKVFHHDPFDSTSLSDNAVSTLFTDSGGKLWIGTMNGRVDLYDSRTEKFKHFLTNNTNKGNINAITEDIHGNIWVGTYGNGIFKLVFKNKNHNEKPTEIQHYTSKPGDKTTLTNNMVIDVFANSNGGIWASTTKGIFQYAKSAQSKLSFSTENFQVVSPEKEIIPQGIKYDLSKTKLVPPKNLDFSGTRFLQDRQNRIWMSTTSGILLLDLDSQRLIYFDPLMPGLEAGNIRSACNITLPEGDRNSEAILVGFLSGAGIFDTGDFTLQLIRNDPANPASLAPGSMLSVFQDKSGSLWLGSSGEGLSQFNTRAALFPSSEYRTADGSIRSEDLSVRSFLSTENYLFVGTQASLMMANRETQLMKPVDLGLNHRGSGPVFSMVSHDSDSFWLASNSGLTLYNYKTNSHQLFELGIEKNGQTDNRIFKIYKDNNDNLWCLTPYSLSFFDIRTEIFQHYFFSKQAVNPFSEPAYGDIYREPSGNFWLGTAEGLLYFNLVSKKFSRYVTKPTDSSSLSFNVVRAILPDPKFPQKFLWIATAGGGLNKLNLKTKKFTHFTGENGLPNNVVYGILSDKAGNLWLSTNKGIAEFNPDTQIFTGYDVNSGLQSNEFNSGAFYKDDDGILYFGGIKGFNAFQPEKINKIRDVPQLAFTGFSIFNRPISFGEKDSPLSGSITETKKIVLPFRDNIISFQVAALDFSDTYKKEYAYKLIPANTDWVQMGNSRLITFSNLEPGNYTLVVKARNKNGIWNEKGISLNLVIRPPWYRTWTAYFVYFFLAVTIIYFIRKYELRRILLRNRLQMEHLESERLKELDHLKSQFFANISHEFRTPLTLIMGPVEDLLKSGNTEKFKEILPQVHRNSKRLLQLINQLLDLSKLDAKKYHINTTREDIIPFVKQVVETFDSLAQRKNIRLQMKTDTELDALLQAGKTKFFFDEDIIEKILDNLLSNAFKFTGNSGFITVRLKISEHNKDFLELSVQDNGIGISQNDLVQIFNRFYQPNNSNRGQYGGSGVGLALVKELTELLDGTVSAESEPGKGTVFYCNLPFNQKILSPKTETESQYKPVSPADFTENEIEPALETATDSNREIILIVEDQPDVRKYIRGKLNETYTILEAGNGKDGLEKARNRIPDLIISDVMMPEMNGFQLCEKLKTDPLTSHIPVILLTARAEDSDRMTGLKTGADAFLTKPFNSEELNIRVNKLIELRKRLRAKFSGRLVIKPSEITVTSLDQDFMKKLMDLTEKHLGNAKFSITQLSEEMNISVSQLNRKLKALIDQSPQKFIRSVRMQRALELLKTGNGNISEISWKVGFEDPGYFTRVFKNHFGCLPSEREKLP